MKNIALATLASIGLGTTTHAQTPKTLFQYQQEIKAVFKKAVQEGKVQQKSFSMAEGDSCYEFTKAKSEVKAQIFYCLDTDQMIFERLDNPAGDKLTRAKQALETIKKEYP